MHITIEAERNTGRQTVLKNNMQVLYRGISFSIDDQNPLYAEKEGTDSGEKLRLLSWKKDDTLSCTFLFTGNVALRFSLSDDTNKAHLTINARFPEDVKNVALPYKIASGANLSDQTLSSLKLTNKKEQWVLSAARITDDRLSVSREEPSVSFSYVERTKEFSFADIAESNKTTEASVAESMNSFENALIAAFVEQVQSAPDAVTEQEAVSYMAVMTQKDRLNEALGVVPSSFTRNGKRTYLSAPYFDSLVKMNQSLDQQLAAYSDAVSASESERLSALTVRNIAFYLALHPTADSVNALLAQVASLDAKKLTVEQTADILCVYVELLDLNGALAEKIQPVTGACIARITAACARDGNTVTVSENGSFLPVIQAAEVGDALLRLGKVSGNSGYIRGGCLILNSALSGAGSFDLVTLADLYPVIVHDNPYYPHFEILTETNGQKIWTWTCARNITSSSDSNGTITLSIDFPQTFTHYLIIRGLPRFNSIYIYDISFHSDPRFETYNSSGFRYDADTKTLLLKSRQKSKVERVRFVYAAGKLPEDQKSFTATDAATGAPVKDAPVSEPERSRSDSSENPASVD